MICEQCASPFVFPSRIEGVCQRCESLSISIAAAENESNPFEDKALTLAQLASKAQTKNYKAIKGAKIR